jgi:hypothetical protein
VKLTEGVLAAAVIGGSFVAVWYGVQWIFTMKSSTEGGS